MENLVHRVQFVAYGVIAAFLLMSAISVVNWTVTAWVCTVSLLISLISNQVSELRFKRWATRPLSDPVKTPSIWRPTAIHLSDTIQDSRDAEKAYIEAFRDIRNTADKLPDACVIILKDGRIGEMNASANGLLGLSKDDTGQYFGALIRDHALNQAIAQSQFNEAIEIVSPPNDQVQLEVRLIALDEDRILLIARDVTQLHKLLSVRQDFIANVSHELKTPITILLGYMESLVDDELDTNTVRELIERLHGPTNRLKALVEDLMTLTQLESEPHLDPANLSVIDGKQLIEKVVNEAEPLGLEKHKFIVSVDPDTRAECVVDEIHSAVLNLVANAIRYSPDGGEITIRWLDKNDDTVRLEVQDCGIGIPNEHIPRITERFYRVKSQPAGISRGTGLGLAIVKHILLRHRTKLNVESTVGEGSLFYFDIPKRVVAT